MSIRRSVTVSLLALVALVGSLLVVSPADATPGSTTQVSLRADGTKVDGYSSLPSISADGSTVVFFAGSGVVAGVTGNHLYARDRDASTTELVDVLPDGTPASAGSVGEVDISSTGRYVVFTTFWFDGCRPSRDDDRQCLDVFRRDLRTDTTELVSVTPGGIRGDADSFDPSISGDGQRVAFTSFATDLGPADVQRDRDVYVRDLGAGTTILASVATDGTQANDVSADADISADGRSVGFLSVATNLGDRNPTEFAEDVYVHDLDSGATTTLLPPGRSAASYDPSLSADGRIVSFSTQDSLVPEDPADGGWSVYVIDRTTGVITAAGADQLTYQDRPQTSDDGRFVLFRGAGEPTLPGRSGVFVLDVATGHIELESVAADGSDTGDPADSGFHSISGDGRFVAFWSASGKFVPGDAPGTEDIFVHDRALPADSVSGSGSASTGSGSGATVSDPVTTTVEGSPGAVSISELAPGDPAAPPPAGYAVLGQQVRITADPAVPPAYLTFTFELDASVVPAGETPADVDLLRNGTALAPCAGAEDIGPCVASRNVLASGDWRFVAHSPEASVWTVAQQAGPPPDATDPTVDLVRPADGASYDVGDVLTAAYTCADTGGSGLASCTGTQPDGGNVDTTTPGTRTFSVTATDGAGNTTTTTATYTVRPDTTPPAVTLTRPVDLATYQLGQAVTASFGCTDTGSGLASCVGTRPNGATIDTSSVGSKSFTVTGTDTAGNRTVRTVGYRVVWPLSGFTSPVDNPPVVNTLKAGGTVPVRFSLGGNRGSGVFAPGSPSTAQVACPTTAPTDEIEQLLTGHPALLTYANGSYTYAWETQKAWRSTCQRLTVRLADGQQLTALFRLR